MEHYLGLRTVFWVFWSFSNLLCWLPNGYLHTLLRFYVNNCSHYTWQYLFAKGNHFDFRMCNIILNYYFHVDFTIMMVPFIFFFYCLSFSLIYSLKGDLIYKFWMVFLFSYNYHYVVKREGERGGERGRERERKETKSIGSPWINWFSDFWFLPYFFLSG